MKKKVNPNKIPLDTSKLDVQALTLETTNKMVLRAWAVILGSIMDFQDVDQERLLSLWKAINTFSTNIHKFKDVEASLKKLERIAGIEMPYTQVSFSQVRTQGDLKRFIRKSEQNAMYSAYTIIIEPMIQDALFSEDDIRLIIKKATSMNEEIDTGDLTVADIQEALLDEFDLLLTDSDSGVKLVAKNPSP